MAKRGFAFVTTPDHLRNELLKLNNIQFREKNLIIEAARSKMKTAKTIAKSNHSTRPQVVVNRFPEHQDVFNGSKLVPGELPYNSAVKSTWLNSGEQNRMISFGDSIFRGIRFREFNNEIKSGYAKFKTFPGADSKEILHYVNPTLESGNYDSAVLHFGVNDLLQKTISKSDSVENLIENIRKTAVKCMSHGVSKVFVSAIVQNKRIPESLLEEVNEKISFMCKNNSFIFVDNENHPSIVKIHKNRNSQSNSISIPCSRWGSKITPKEINTILKTLNSKKAPGIDKIPTKLVKLASDI